MAGTWNSLNASNYLLRFKYIGGRWYMFVIALVSHPGNLLHIQRVADYSSEPNFSLKGLSVSSSVSVSPFYLKTACIALPDYVPPSGAYYVRVNNTNRKNIRQSQAPDEFLPSIHSAAPSMQAVQQTLADAVFVRLSNTTYHLITLALSSSQMTALSLTAVAGTFPHDSNQYRHFLLERSVRHPGSIHSLSVPAVISLAAEVVIVTGGVENDKVFVNTSDLGNSWEVPIESGTMSVFT